ncbi:4'-phosphopantetheinyl transferase family protein [Streptomyces griseofuscus]|uniref:4'-phosphopantetheinyl transferase family protein n=1 Tax=Streptomyces griseofuscus TaxID=146922 RepID=UPI000B868F67|nr:4'-phosphopantetheinyl transferase superfamily protein [Streptomyces sp. DconLS]MBJ7004268.1 4'-phosphopantetheinyl transferase superfamily protein [Streptomyces sp. CRPSP2-6A1]MYQ92842.1 4'-phosphopantetheinyl transferase superfamily protein [Streptomyces sp. SID4946]
MNTYDTPSTAGSSPVESTPQPVRHSLPPPGTPDLWLLRLSDTTDAGSDAAPDAATLDASERERAASFARPVDRVRFTAAHRTLRTVLGSYLGVPPGEIRYARETCPCCGGPHGRPALLGFPGDLHFSLSHRGDLVLIGVAGEPIGVDVELVPDLEGSGELALMLHPDEQREARALDPVRRPGAVARLWTRKEAYLKGLGTGLGRDPALDYIGLGTPDDGPRPRVDWHFRDVPVDRGYVASVATRGPLTAPATRPNRVTGRFPRHR